jgi:MFS family permease
MYVLCAYSTSIYIMMAAYGVIGGISIGCTYISSLIIVAKYFDKLKGVTTGITMSGSGFGSFAMAPVTTFLINMFDWKVTLVVLGGMILQCVILTKIYEKKLII